MNPGIYDISNDAYHSGQGFSRSTLLEFLKSPLHFWHAAFGEKASDEPPKIINQTHALYFGNALHTAILEPHLFEKEYLVMPKVNRATKAGKELYANKLDEAGDRLLIEEPAYKSIMDMLAGIERNKRAVGLIRDAEYEKSIYWTDDDTELLCKVRPDVWHSNMIVDLKTAADASFKAFQSSVFKYGYHVQAAMIQEGIKQVCGVDIKHFLYVVVEKQPPYAVGIYMLDPLAISTGYVDFKNILNGVKECQDQDNWPSYPDGVITVPAWAVNQYQ